MPFNHEIVEELNVLVHYSLDSQQVGIKIHSDAHPQVKAATERLFQKHLITQNDGGYLTDLGREVTEHADAILSILRSN